MGLALNELVKIKYLSKWDVQKMSSKNGYKIVLAPGDELLKILDNTRPERRDSPSLPTPSPPHRSSAASTPDEERALELLKHQGVLPAKAERLLEAYGAEIIADTVEYLTSQMLSGKRKNVANPAGLIIYSLENGFSMPSGCVSSRKQKTAENAARQYHRERDEKRRAEMEYARWVEEQQELVLKMRFPGDQLGLKLEEMLFSLEKTDDRIRRMPLKGRQEVAYQMLRKEVGSEINLPTFVEWRSTQSRSICPSVTPGLNVTTITEVAGEFRTA